MRTARPCSKRRVRPSTRPAPRTRWMGRLMRTTPSVRLWSGVVNTSSVGMLTTIGAPQRVSVAAFAHRAPARRPTIRSVPPPRKRSAEKLRSCSSAARSRRRAMCSRHADAGSGASKRSIGANSSQRRSTSGVPSHARATPGHGPGTTVQAISPRSAASQNDGVVGIESLPTRSGAMSSSSSGCGSRSRGAD